MFICTFCNRQCKNSNSFRNHSRLCKANPNRQISTFEREDIQNTRKKSNQWIKSKELNIEPYGLQSKEAKAKIALLNKVRGQSVEARQKISIAAKLRGLGGHTSKQKLYFKKKNGDVVYLQSSYEIKFAAILEDLNIVWERPDPLHWIDKEGIEHRYYPDFKINNKYFDTKNDFLANKDKEKINQVSLQNKVTIEIVTLDKINKEYILNAL